MKRDTERPPRYFPLPNEIFSLGLNAPEIEVLAYLMYRKTGGRLPAIRAIRRSGGR